MWGSTFRNVQTKKKTKKNSVFNLQLLTEFMLNKLSTNSLSINLALLFGCADTKTTVSKYASSVQQGDILSQVL